MIKRRAYALGGDVDSAGGGAKGRVGDAGFYAEDRAALLRLGQAQLHHALSAAGVVEELGEGGEA